MIEKLKELCSVGGSVEVKASDLQVLIKTISDQERELMANERAHETLREKVRSLLDNLECYDFSEFAPNADFADEIFEVFIGTAEDYGRVFAIWDAESGAFHEPPQEGCQLYYYDNVLFWRYCLPEPNESLDLGEDI